MRSPHRIAIALTSVAVAVAVAVGAGGATISRTAWSRLSGPTQPGVQLGLARTEDGVLHVIWNRGTTPTSIFETRFSPTGAAGGTSTVATGWDGNGGLAALVMPDKTLRLFAAGATRPGSASYGINTFTAPSSGRTWTLQSGVFWGGAVANASGVIGATLTKDGQPVTAWRGFAAQGVPPTVPPNAYEAGMTASLLTTDGASGDVVLSGVTNAGNGGLYIQRVMPSIGPKVVLPLPFGQNDWYSSPSGRIGAPGVYLAYADGKAVRLYRYGGGSKMLASGQFTSAAACAAPEGRLWVAWGNTVGDVFVTRSNRAAGAFEPVQKVKLAQGANGLMFMQCEGSAGPDDLFAYVPGAAAGFWHTHVLAQLSLAARGQKAGSTISVRDAGDPLAGVKIAVAGRHLTTDAHGLASAKLRAGSYTATATAPGYAPASAHFTVR